MKKTISVVLALAMILMMSLSAFAYSFVVDTPKPEDPEDVEGWTAYYTEITTKIAAINDENQRGDQESEFRGELMNDVMSGAMSISTATQVLQAISGSAGEDSPIAGIIEQIQGVIGNLPSELPSIELPSELPSEFPSDITLPSVGGDDSGDGSLQFSALSAALLAELWAATIQPAAQPAVTIATQAAVMMRTFGAARAMIPSMTTHSAIHQ